MFKSHTAKLIVFLALVSSLFLAMLLVASHRVISTVQESFRLPVQNRVNESDKGRIFEIEKGGSVSSEATELYRLFAAQPIDGDSQNKLPVRVFKNNCNRPYCTQRKRHFSEIPFDLVNILISIEDKRYLDHRGVDLKSIIRALIVDLKARKFVQGGSTLTQQVIKNLYLTNEKSFERKLKEMIIAAYLESNYSKEEIVATYLNETFWGAVAGTRVKGFYSASLYYFSKLPRELTTYEMIILIAMLKGPGYYSPTKHLARLQQRVVALTKKLERENVYEQITTWSYKRWLAWSREIASKDNIWWSNMWFMTKYSMDFEQLNIVMSTERVMKQLAKRIPVKEFGVKVYKIKDINCIEKCENIFYYSRQERSQRKALQEELHSVGSILKPFFYHQYFKLGMDPNEQLKTSGLKLSLKSGPWSPRDNWRARPNSISAKDALRLSKNIPTIDAASKIGFDLIEEVFENYDIPYKKPLQEYPSQILGAVEVSVAQLAESYKKYLRHACASKEGRIILEALSDPSRGTVRKMANKFIKSSRYFGKTGTGNNGLDNWYVASNLKELYLIWIGYEGNRKNKRFKIAGATSAFPIYQEIIGHNGKRFRELQCASN